MAHNPWALYDLLLDNLPQDQQIDAVTLGLTWTLARVDGNSGLAMSPETPCRTLAWAGSLQGRPAKEIAAWTRSWQPHEATVGMACLNAMVNANSPLMDSATPLFANGPANLTVFEHFHDQLQGKRVVVIGRYPGLSSLQSDVELTVIERKPEGNDLPDQAAEYVLSDADWVFLTASSITNKTFPRIAELAQDAKLVLMGPTTPWLPQLHEFGVDYLAGVRPRDPAALQQTVAEGGGTRIFEKGVQYALVDLQQDEAARLKSAIAAVFARRATLKAEMEAWYAQGKLRYPNNDELLRIDAELASLDTRFKQVWDAQQAANKTAQA
jgi:uncharacterized protein (DUF4213/DUF364 family)